MDAQIFIWPTLLRVILNSVKNATLHAGKTVAAAFVETRPLWCLRAVTRVLSERNVRTFTCSVSLTLLQCPRLLGGMEFSGLQKI